MENTKFTKFLAFCQNDGLFSAFYALQKQTLSLNVWKLCEFWIFNFETIILNLEIVFSNLEPEGKEGGIIMEVTRQLLLGPFYYIQTNFSILFCTRLYNGLQRKKFSDLSNAPFKSSDDFVKSETNCNGVFLKRKINYIPSKCRRRYSGQGTSISDVQYFLSIVDLPTLSYSLTCDFGVYLEPSYLP